MMTTTKVEALMALVNTSTTPEEIRAASMARIAKPEASQSADELEAVLASIPLHMQGSDEARRALVKAPHIGRVGGFGILQGLSYLRHPGASLDFRVACLEATARKTWVNHPETLKSVLSLIAVEAGEVQGNVHWGIALSEDPKETARALAQSFDRTAPGRTYYK